mmetsp:Transcript_62071/g.74686  ORF Transcript_62071/g.74686 Transcript_62071/m.74686 type:complete len:97 (-) Transcript_62071:90-380(-)
MTKILDDLRARFPGRSFCFTMDNLNVHTNPMVINAILNDGHKFVFRAAYYAIDGVIEYTFNTQQTSLMVFYNKLEHLDDLANRSDQIINKIASFRP